MPESLEPTTSPESWIAGLRTRGIRLWVKNNRLRTSNFKALTPDDRRFIDAHRADIKRLVEADPDDPYVGSPATEAKAPEVPALEPTEYARYGLFKLRGVITHALGDEFAQRVLNDPAVRPQAVEMERRRAIEVAQLSGRAPTDVKGRPMVDHTAAKKKVGGAWGR